jgi:HEAT repeat protein
LLNELQHPDPVVRWVASGLLSNLADKRTVSALLDCLTSDLDSDVRINAAVALGRIGDPRAISMLEWVSQHDSGVGRQGHQVGSTASTAIQQIVERQSGTVQE